MEKTPSYDGFGLVNLVAEIETRLGGSPPARGLEDSSMLTEAPTVVLVLFDGLGVSQLDHSDAGIFRASNTGSLDAPFPSTTSVSLATIATGLTPGGHGQVAHLTWMPELDQVVNCLKWVTLAGEHVAYDYAGVLPGPNLWERLRSVGVEPITVQPGDFQSSPLTRVLYRGARFEGAWDAEDLGRATVSLAAEPGRLIFTYVPFVDFAGHVFGEESSEFSDAMKLAASIWETILSGVGPHVLVLGTADHGLLSVSEEDKILIRDSVFDDLRFAGDTRGVHLWGDQGLMQRLAEETGSVLTDPIGLIGESPTDVSRSRLGEQILLAPAGKALLPRGFDKRLKAYHGGLSDQELKIPLLVG